MRHNKVVSEAEHRWLSEDIARLCGFTKIGGFWKCDYCSKRFVIGYISVFGHDVNDRMLNHFQAEHLPHRRYHPRRQRGEKISDIFD